MIYKKSKPNNSNKPNKKNNFIYEPSSRKPPSLSYKETNNLSKISDIYKYLYEDFFPKILTFRSKESVINEIEKKALIILHNNFSDEELQSSFIKISIKKIKEEISNKLNKDYSFLQESLINIKKAEKKTNFLTHFRKHCCKTEDIACHLCDNGKQGKFIEIKKKFSIKNDDISYVICDKCNFCYEKNFIKMYCIKCEKNYYSEVLKQNENVNCLPATWENYHCGTRIKEIMKCLKCKHILYINLTNNKLICLNKKCNFCISPEKIIWECYLCNTEFSSGAKIYNPLEFEIVKKTINRAILYKNKAKPPYLLCCNGEINNKIIFYHKKECKGELYTYYLNNKEIVVCQKCRALNNYDKFLWLCPLCGDTFKLSDKERNHNNYNNNKYNKNHFNHIYLSTNKNQSMRLGDNNHRKLGDLNPATITEKNSSKEYNRNLSRFPNIKYSVHNIMKTGENIPSYMGDKYQLKLKFYSKKNRSNDISYDRSRKYPNNRIHNESEDFSISHIQNKSSVNLIENNRNNNLIKVSKSIEQKNELVINPKLKRRKRETLYEILNRRKNTPNFGRKKIENFENENDEGNEKQNEEVKNRTSFGFFPNKNRNKILDNEKNNLSGINSKEDFIRNNGISNYNKNSSSGIRKLIFNKVLQKSNLDETENENNDNNLNSIEQNCDHHKNIYLNGHRKRRIVSESICITEDKKNQNLELKIDNNKFKRRNLFALSSKNFNTNFKHNKSSLSNRIIKNYLNRNLFTPLNKEESEKKETKEKDNKNDNNKLFNKTAEYFRRKDYLMKKELIPNGQTPFKSKVSNLKRDLYKQMNQIKCSVSLDYMISDKKDKIDANKKSSLMIDRDGKNERMVHKFSLKKVKIKNNDVKNEEKNNENESFHEKKFGVISKNLFDVISEDKIESISKNCPIPSFDEEDYTYISPIGEGSFGQIFLVQDKKSKKQFALKKVLCKDLQELLKFKKEFELLYSLKNNNNIMKIYKLQMKSLDITTSCLYVLMERAKNDWSEEIKNRARAKKYYKENEIISILKQISSGLYYLKKNNVAHRDIKPQNILIFPNNVYKIADLGEAKSMRSNRVQMATLRGSELFMSPLLYNGLKFSKQNIRHNPYKSDMFSLGLCFLYALCLTIRVLENIREMNSMKNIKNTIYRYLDKNRYSDKLIKVILRMIDLDENIRYDFDELEKEMKTKF